MNVNLQVVELEQYIYGMKDVGRGVTKDRRTILYIYIYISFAQFIPVYVGLAQARPNKHNVHVRLCLMCCGVQ